MAKTVSEPPDWLLEQSATLSLTDRVERLAHREQIRRALASLMPQQRAAVLLHRMGYSEKEIATQMGISVNSLREHLRQGYLKLMASRVHVEG